MKYIRLSYQELEELTKTIDKPDEVIMENE